MTAIACSPDGDVLAASVDNRIKFWDTATWREINPSKTHNTPVSTLAFSSDGKYLLSGSLLGKVILWDWKKKTPIWTWDLSTNSFGVDVLTISSDDHLIGVTANPAAPRDGEGFHILELQTGKLISSFGGRYYNKSNILFSMNNKTAFTAESDGSIAEWDVIAGKLKSRISTKSAIFI